MADELRQKVERTAGRLGIVDDHDPRYADLPELAGAEADNLHPGDPRAATSKTKNSV